MIRVRLVGDRLLNHFGGVQGYVGEVVYFRDDPCLSNIKGPGVLAAFSTLPCWEAGFDFWVEGESIEKMPMRLRLLGFTPYVFKGDLDRTIVVVIGREELFAQTFVADSREIIVPESV